MDGVDKKDQLLQMYRVERKRILVVHKTVPNASQHHVSNIIYRKHLGRKNDHLKFRIDLIEGLLVKLSIQHEEKVTEILTTL
jgi:hypothetical protein